MLNYAGHPIELGSLQKLRGLKKAEHLNGKIVEVQEFFPSKRRYKCCVQNTQKILAVKPENLGHNNEMSREARDAAKLNTKKAGKTFRDTMKSDPDSAYDQLEDVMKMFQQTANHDVYSQTELSGLLSLEEKLIKSRNTPTGELYYQNFEGCCNGLAFIGENRSANASVLKGIADALRLDTILCIMTPELLDVLIDVTQRYSNPDHPDCVVVNTHAKVLQTQMYGAPPLERLHILDAAICVAPKEPHLHFMKASILVMLERHKDGLVCINEAIALAGERGRKYFHHKATFLHWLGRHREAVKLLKQYLKDAMECERDYLKAYIELGMNYLQLGDLKNARGCYEKSQEIRKSRPPCFPADDVLGKELNLKTGMMIDKKYIRKCGYCKKERINMMRCECGQVYYCNKRHQKQHWKKHKKKCTAKQSHV